MDNPTEAKQEGNGGDPSADGDSRNEATASSSHEFKDMSKANDEYIVNGLSKDASNPLHQTNGAFFGYAALPMLFFSCMIFTIHFAVYMAGYGWDRNPVALLLGLQDPFIESTKIDTVLTSHSLLGLTGGVMVILQVLSAVRFQGKTSQYLVLRQIHSMNGYITFFVWTTITALGILFLFLSEKYTKHPMTSKIFRYYVLFIYIGIFSVVNMAIGVVAAAMKKSRFKSTKEQPEGTGELQSSTGLMVIHKACMFFGINWIMSSAFDECVTAVTQSILSDCNIEEFGLLLCVVIGQSVQLFVFIGAAWYFDRIVFRLTVVRVNLFFWLLRIVLMTIPLYFMTPNERCV